MSRHEPGRGGTGAEERSGAEPKLVGGRSPRRLALLLALSAALGTGPVEARGSEPVQAEVAAQRGSANPVGPGSDGSRSASRSGWSELDVVEVMVRHNPTLHQALLEEAQARVQVRAEEALYVPILSASAGLTHARQPGVARAGALSMSTTDSVDLGLGLSKAFPLGTVVGLSVAGQRTLRQSPASLENPIELRLGPTYSTSARLSLTQPLLRGAGTDVGLQSLRQARLRQTMATLSRQQTASQLLYQVLSSYWELWYQDQVVQINRASHKLALEREQQAIERVASGALPRSEALPFMTQRAQLEEAVVTAEATRLERALGLVQLLGQPGRPPEEVYPEASPPPEPPEGPPPRLAVEEALSTSFRLRQLVAQIELSRDQARTAGDSLRPRLDLGAYVEVAGLGYREVPPAFRQMGELEAVSAHVGLSFETPVSDTRRKAQVENAQLSVRIAEKQVEAARQELESKVRSAIAAKEAARHRLRLATETEKVARAQAMAERERLAAGASVALEVEQAEDSLRQSQLRVERARVDLVLAELELLNLRGRLLERYAHVLERLHPNPAALEPGGFTGPF